MVISLWTYNFHYFFWYIFFKVPCLVSILWPTILPMLHYPVPASTDFIQVAVKHCSLSVVAECVLIFLLFGNDYFGVSCLVIRVLESQSLTCLWQLIKFVLMSGQIIYLKVFKIIFFKIACFNFTNLKETNNNSPGVWSGLTFNIWGIKCSSFDI